MILFNSFSNVFAFSTFLPQQGVIIYEANSGHVLYAQNETQRMIPSSTTKLMTALVLLNTIDDLNEVVTVGEEVNDYGWMDSSSWLWVGQKLTYEQLLYAMLLPSGNDASGVIAKNVGKVLLDNPNADKETATKAFVNEMNKTAKRLGLSNTNFLNPSGRYEEGHYVSPYDMAIIAAEAFKYDILEEVTTTLKYELPAENGSTYTIKNTDLILYPNAPEYGSQLNPNPNPNDPNSINMNPYYSPLISGGKTGSTEEGGKSFVFYSKQADADVVGVIFNSPEDHSIFAQSKENIEYLNNNYSIETINKGNNYSGLVTLNNVHFNSDPELEFSTDDTVYIYDLTSELENYQTSIRWDTRFIDDQGDSLTLIRTIDEGDKVGALLVSKDDTVINTIPIYSNSYIEPTNWFDHYWYTIPIGIGLFIILIIIATVIILRKRKLKRSKLSRY